MAAVARVERRRELKRGRCRLDRGVPATCTRASSIMSIFAEFSSGIGSCRAVVSFAILGGRRADGARVRARWRGRAQASGAKADSWAGSKLEGRVDQVRAGTRASSRVGSELVGRVRVRELDDGLVVRVRKDRLEELLQQLRLRVPGDGLESSRVELALWSGVVWAQGLWAQGVRGLSCLGSRSVEGRDSAARGAASLTGASATPGR